MKFFLPSIFALRFVMRKKRKTTPEQEIKREIIPKGNSIRLRENVRDFNLVHQARFVKR